MKIKLGIVLLSALFGAGGAILHAPATSAATLDASALARAAKASSILHDVPCRWRTVCRRGPYRRGCVRRRVCW
jgi:hypothetical protein